MKRHVGMIVLALGVVVVLLLTTVAYQVDELSDIVLVKTFERITDVKVGSQSGQAGLHFKYPYPFQRIVRYDQRAQVLESPIAQMSTKDLYNVLPGMFCSWRIANPRNFNKWLEEMPRAVELLRNQLNSSTKDVFSQYWMSQVINTDPKGMVLDKIESQIRDQMQAAVGQYGVEIIKVGVKSITLPTETTKVAIEVQKEERNTEARALEAVGASEAEAIRARANTAHDIILSFADRKAAEIRSRGMEQAAEHYKKFREKPELAMFLRTLESLEAELQRHSIILLDSSVLPGVKWLQTNKPDVADLTARAEPKKAEPAKTEPAKAEPKKDDKKDAPKDDPLREASKKPSTQPATAGAR